MKNEILTHLEDPHGLENLYQKDKQKFRIHFNELWPELESTSIAQFWNARLNYIEPSDQVKPRQNQILYLLALIIGITGFLFKGPELFNINTTELHYFERNTALILFLALILLINVAYQNIKRSHFISIAGVFSLLFLYINLLPVLPNSDSLYLVYLHLPILAWCLLGLVFTNFQYKSTDEVLKYIKYNGDIIIISGLILITGGIIIALTIGLFSVIDINVEEFYSDYFVFWALPAIPLIATYIIKKQPNMTNKIAPTIAHLFSPFILLTLVIYLISIIITGKDPYSDRDFLLIFNMVVLGVLMVIVFAVSETSKSQQTKWIHWVLWALSLVTLCVNLVALSAIIYRLNEYGFTPNRLVVLGSNLLIFMNLILISIELTRSTFKDQSTRGVEQKIVRYIPVYFIWTLFVVFILPFVYQFQ